MEALIDLGGLAGKLLANTGQTAKIYSEDLYNLTAKA